MADEPLDRPQSWRTGLLALVVWAAHFVAVYAAGLIFPGQPVVRWLALAAMLAALGALAWLWLRDGSERTALGTISILLAGLFVVYDTLPALLG